MTTAIADDTNATAGMRENWNRVTRKVDRCFARLAQGRALLALDEEDAGSHPPDTPEAMTLIKQAGAFIGSFPAFAHGGLLFTAADVRQIIRHRQKRWFGQAPDAKQSRNLAITQLTEASESLNLACHLAKIWWSTQPTTDPLVAVQETEALARRFQTALDCYLTAILLAEQALRFH